MVKISSVEVIFGKNIAYRVPYFSRMVVIINSGLTKKLWILFTQKKTRFTVTLTLQSWVFCQKIYNRSSQLSAVSLILATLIVTFTMHQRSFIKSNTISCNKAHFVYKDINILWFRDFQIVFFIY